MTTEITLKHKILVQGTQQVATIGIAVAMSTIIQTKVQELLHLNRKVKNY